MKTVYKYPLEVQENNVIDLPYEKILGIYQDRTGKHCLYALVDTDRPDRKYVVSMYGTGWDLGDRHEGKDYLGTIRLNDVLILHVFGKEIL